MDLARQERRAGEGERSEALVKRNSAQSERESVSNIYCKLMSNSSRGQGGNGMDLSRKLF